VELAIMIRPSWVAQSAFTTAPAGISPWLIYLERAMSRFPGERDNRDAADPAAFGANALAEPTAESTVGLVSHPHPGKLDHCGAQTWISCLRDTLLVVDATTLPWAGSQACIGCQLPSVLEVPEQTLKVEHGSELRANALEPHK
jgi:hypothetical protein